MVRVARSITRVRSFIDATLEHGLSNGRVESINAKICLIRQRAFGLHHPSALIALIALAMLTHSGIRPALPGRARRAALPWATDPPPGGSRAG